MGLPLQVFFFFSVLCLTVFQSIAGLLNLLLHFCSIRVQGALPILSLVSSFKFYIYIYFLFYFFLSYFWV